MQSLKSRLLVEWLEDRTQPATVTSTADSGPGSLRDAIAASEPFEIIDFDLPSGLNFITLTSGELVLPHTLFIIGPGADQLVISGNNSSRVFHAAVDSGGFTLIRDLTVADGRVASPEVGGAILNEVNLDLVGVVVRDSQVSTVSGPALGGGIHSTSSGSLFMFNVTVHSNAADIGGGVSSDGDLFASNLTVSGNTARVSGGGLRVSGVANLNHTTVANNINVGVQVDGATVTYQNTLFSGNTGGNVVGFGGSIESNGGNLSSDGTGNLTGIGDLPNTDPLLGPLSNYGGSIPLHALLPGSPAIDAGILGEGGGDPRGVSRIDTDGDGDGTAGSDIGAFEVPVYFVTDTTDFTFGTFRAAIDANNEIGGGRIEFQIDVGGVATIRPFDSQGFSAFAPIRQPLFIDGWSQGGPGYTGPPLIQLDGSFLMPGMGVNGLVIESVGVVVAGLAINNFPTDGNGDLFFSGGYGIVVRTFGEETPGVWLHGNYIGTDATGKTAAPNASGGIYVDGEGVGFLSNPPADVLIGTNADGINDAAERNIISGNNGPGVTIDSKNVRVAGNRIGTDVSGGSPLGNAGAGVLAARGQVVIGGATAAENNVIAFNSAAGVAVDNSLGITVQRNSIFSNAGGGIVYLPPFADPPNVPSLIAAAAGGTTTVQGIVSSPGLSPLTIQFYAEPAGTPPATAQGRTFLGSAVVVPDSFGIAEFTVSGLAGVAPGQVITATSTTTSGSTSAFSFGIEAAGPTSQFNIFLLGDPPPGGFVAGSVLSIEVRAADAEGRPTPLYTGTVRFTSSDPQALVPADNTFTPADNGSKVFAVTFRTAGNQTVTATDLADPTIAGTTGAPIQAAAASLLRVAVPSEAMAGESFSVLVTARDAFGNVATSYTGTVAFTSSDPQAVLPAPVTFTSEDEGQRTVTVEYRTAGNRVLTAQDTVNGAINGSVGTLVSPGGATQLTIVGPSSATAGVGAAFTVTAFDAFGNTATGYLGQVTFSSTDAQATLPAAYTFTPADAGQRAFTVTFRTAGTQTLTVTDVEQGSLTRNALTSVAPGPAARLDLGPPIAANAGVASSFTITVFDAFGNVATSYTGTVAITSSDPQATLPANFAFTAADAGQRTVSVTLRTAGPQTVTVADTANAALAESIAASVAPGPAARFDLGPPIAANAGVVSSFTITAFDAFGNVATNYTGTVAVTSSDPLATLPANFAFTAADAGQRTVSVTLRTAGPQTVTVADTANAALAESVAASVAPGPATRLDLTASAAMTAGAAGTMTVILFDAFGNVATGYRGTVTFTSTDAQATLPAAYTFTAADAGRHVFQITYRTAGLQTATVRDTVNGAITGSAATIVTAGPASRFDVVPAGPATAGEPITVTITPFDAFGNVTTDYAGTVRFTSTDPRATLPIDVVFPPNSGGQSATVSVTFRTAGSQTLTVSDTTNSALTASAAVTVSPGTATRLALTGLPGTAAAGLPLLFTITAFDAFDNIAVGFTGTVSFTSTDPQAALPAAYTFTPGDAGARSFAVSFGTAGSQTLTADGAGLTTQAVLAVTAAEAESVTVTGPTGPVIAGGEALFTVVVRDRFGNIATDYAGTLTVTSTDPQAVLPAPAGLAGGTGTFAVTFRTAGSHSVTVSDGLISGAAVGISVVAAAAARFDLTAPPTATVGTPFDVTVTAFDAFGNVAAGYAGTVQISTAGPPVEGTFTPADAGRRTFSVTLSAAGDQAIVATDTIDPAVRGETVVATANPAPGTITLETGSVRVGRAFTLGVTGGPFVPGSVVVFGGQELATRFVDAGRLEVDVPADAVAAVGTIPVLVRSPGPGGGDSPPATFSVTSFTLTPIPEDELITPVIDVPFGQELGRFRSDDPTITADDLTAIIDWGDGTVEQGEVVALADGTFAVVGSHTYPDTLSYLVTVTVRGPGGVEVAAFRFAVVSTPSGRPVLGVTQVVLVPSGAPTSSAAVDGVQADFVRTTQMDRTLLLRVSRYQDDPADQLDPTVVMAGAYDVQLIGAVSEDRLTVTFQYDAPPGSNPRFQFFNVATGQYEDVVGDPILSNSLVIDTTSQTITVVFTSGTTPAVTELLGTVFVVTVSVPPAVPTPLRAGDLGGRFADAPGGAAGIGFTQLVSATVVGNAPPADVAVGEAGMIAIIGDTGGEGDGNLPFLPADELSLTVRPSQDQVLAPGDTIIPPGEPAPAAEDVLLGPYLPDGPPAPGTTGPYLNDGIRQRLRVFRDHGQLKPNGSSAAPAEKPAVPTGSGPAAPAGSSGEGEGEEAESSPDLDAEDGADHRWWWASVAVAVAVGVRAAVPSAAAGGGRPRYRLGLESAAAD